MSEPEVALIFTPEPWVEELHRHLTDHGGARVRQVVVEPGVALEEAYEVLVVSHRWPALTYGFVADLHATGRAVLGVYDREEPAGREHLEAVKVDRVLPSDSGLREFVDALQRLRTGRGVLVDGYRAHEPGRGTLVAVGGPPGSGRTEIAIELARALRAPLIDADDVAPAIANRLGLPIEPNLRTAIDAVEHARGLIEDCVVPVGATGLRVVPGLPNPRAWSQVRPGEVLRVVSRVAERAPVVVVDGAGSLEEIAATTRPRHAVARAIVVEAAVVVAVCDATPVGVARLCSWAADARMLNGEAPMRVVVNRAPVERYRRGELFEEIIRSLPWAEIVFVPYDRRVVVAAWDGTPVPRGRFTRAVAGVARLVTPAATGSRRAPVASDVQVAS